MAQKAPKPSPIKPRVNNNPDIDVSPERIAYPVNSLLFKMDGD